MSDIKALQNDVELLKKGPLNVLRLETKVIWLMHYIIQYLILNYVYIVGHNSDIREGEPKSS